MPGHASPCRWSTDRPHPHDRDCPQQRPPARLNEHRASASFNLELKCPQLQARQHAPRIGEDVAAYSADEKEADGLQL